MLIPYLFFFKKKIAIQTQTSIPLKTPPLPFNRTRTWFFFLSLEFPHQSMAFEKMCVSRRRQFQQENKKNPASSKLIITSFENNNKKRKVPYSIFRLLSLWRGQPLQIGEKILFFFSLSFSIPFWRWISFTTKKNYNKTTILSSFFSRFPRVCVCVWRNNRKSLSGLCLLYNARDSHLSTEMSA